MTLLRRLEIITGGPARPFDLTVREAGLLRDALELYAHDYRRNAKTVPAEEPIDYQADSELLAHIHDLRRRLSRFGGFTR